jgi:hypothetical protein
VEAITESAAGGVGVQFVPQRRHVVAYGLMVAGRRLSIPEQIAQYVRRQLSAERQQRQNVPRFVAAEVVSGQANAAGADLQRAEEPDLIHEPELSGT